MTYDYFNDPEGRLTIPDFLKREPYQGPMPRVRARKLTMPKTRTLHPLPKALVRKLGTLGYTQGQIANMDPARAGNIVKFRVPSDKKETER